METQVINTYDLATLPERDVQRLLRRAEAAIDDVVDKVRPIVEAVRSEGDAALLRYTSQFDNIELTPDRLRVTPDEIAAAHEELAPAVHAAVRFAIDRVRTVHEVQRVPAVQFSEVSPGVLAGERVTAIDSVGLYIPRGKGAFPSVMYMLAVPAEIAGVPRVVVVTPPGPGGTVDPATLVAADLCGVHEIYRVGGAQAIAALAYGTATIRAVHKITGPGSQPVAAAKRLVADFVDVGLPAGPSEAIILADGSADPEIVAREVLNEAEHGPDSSSLLVTDSRELADAVAPLLEGKISALPEPRQEFARTGLASPGGTGGIVMTTTMEEAVAFVNRYAPEHLGVLVAEPMSYLDRLTNAGEILLGPYTAIAAGNFTIGTNAILPTGGRAHTYSCTGVMSYMKRTGVAYVTSQAAYESLQQHTRVLASFEGFPGHANAMADRNPVGLKNSVSVASTTGV